MKGFCNFSKINSDCEGKIKPVPLLQYCYDNKGYPETVKLCQSCYFLAESSMKPYTPKITSLKQFNKFGAYDSEEKQMIIAEIKNVMKKQVTMSDLTNELAYKNINISASTVRKWIETEIKRGSNIEVHKIKAHCTGGFKIMYKLKSS